MSQDILRRIIQTALDEATRLGINITISVVDMGGHLIALQRMTGCGFLALDSSLKKAVTASQLNSPTHLLAEIEQKMPSLQRAFDKDAHILTLPGGFPIMVAGESVGGLGVAGGNFEQDKLVAQKAAQALA